MRDPGYCVVVTGCNNYFSLYIYLYIFADAERERSSSIPRLVNVPREPEGRGRSQTPRDVPHQYASARLQQGARSLRASSSSTSRTSSSYKNSPGGVVQLAQGRAQEAWSSSVQAEQFRVHLPH